MYNIFFPERQKYIATNSLEVVNKQILKNKINQHFYQSNKIHDVAFKPRMIFLRFKNP